MDVISWARIAAGALPFLFLAGFALLRFSRGRDRAGSFVDAFTAWTIVSYVASEIFSWFGALAFYPFLVLWIVATGLVGLLLWNTRWGLAKFFTVERSLPVFIVIMVTAVTLFIALTAAPNNWDSQCYHLPRIEHWLQDRSFAFYPTWNSWQNELGPLAEILLLQTRVLSGSDFYYLLIQWISMGASIAAVFRITGQLGGNREQCWIAAVFLATLPIGILESTSTQTDYVIAAFLTAFITFGLEAIARPRAALSLILVVAAAGAMAGFVKPIGYAIGGGFALWFAVALSRGVKFAAWLQRLGGVVIVAAVVVGPFATQFLRGAHVSDLNSLVLNSSTGVRQTLDTVIRHSLSNLATGIGEIDDRVVRIEESITYRIGLQTYRADTTDPLHPYVPVPGLLIYHEDFGPNPLHTILLTLALLSVAIRWPNRPSKHQLIYCAAWLAGIVAFALLFRFGMWVVRYHLPGFAAGAPIFALAWPVHWLPSKKTVALLLVLGLTSVPVLLLNQSRELLPLSRAVFPALGRDRISYLTQTPLQRLFVNQPQLLEPYRQAIDVIARSNASQIGIVMDRQNYEYPIWSMLRHRERHAIRIEAVAVPGGSYWPLGPFTPEVIFWDKGEGDPPLILNVNEVEFRRIYDSGPLPHPNPIAVYERAANG